MTTYAVPCNGKVECQEDADESWLCTDSKYLLFTLLGFLGITVALATISCRSESSNYKLGRLDQKTETQKQKLTIERTK